jgi:regulatory protein
VDEVLTDLQTGGLLDDQAFARAWVESRTRSKGYGRVRLEAELRRKGVDSQFIGDALQQLEADGEMAQARRMAARLLGAADIADCSVRRKLAACLQRRGYSWPTIEQVISDIASNS